MSDPKVTREAELAFWRGYAAQFGANSHTVYYRDFMLRMGGLDDDALFAGKVCLDIGCGPLGSLTWLGNARLAVGLDPLARAYRQLEIRHHAMSYIEAGAEAMPFADGSIDVVFSMNSLDHVADLEGTCREVRRILKPGGRFIASLNLLEPPTPTEPWTLTEPLLAEILFDGWEREFYRVRPKVESDPWPYRYFSEPCPKDIEEADLPQALWCRFRVPERADAAP